jgi:hypothetical protein
VPVVKRLVRDPWFGPKRVGWGLAPIRWQGWAATGLFIVVVCATLAGILSHGHQYLGLAVALCVVEVLAFIAFGVLTSIWLEPR